MLGEKRVNHGGRYSLKTGPLVYIEAASEAFQEAQHPKGADSSALCSISQIEYDL